MDEFIACLSKENNVVFDDKNPEASAVSYAELQRIAGLLEAHRDHCEAKGMGQGEAYDSELFYRNTISKNIIFAMRESEAGTWKNEWKDRVRHEFSRLVFPTPWNVVIVGKLPRVPKQTYGVHYHDREKGETTKDFAKRIAKEERQSGYTAGILSVEE